VDTRTSERENISELLDPLASIPYCLLPASCTPREVAVRIRQPARFRQPARSPCCKDAASDAAERLLRAILLNDAAERCC